ncbi:f-box protein [Nicotiana attenuata]|uniref:F-box protein n=2 Tax=Nicotiana attenuata TaxID=49451 RepID=A0A1J6KAH6_NICAT|nr:f-box protein [Nicotiana attenuata]
MYICGRYDMLIISFDLADEIFTEVPNVDFNVDQKIGDFHLTVLGDCLVAAITLPHQNGGAIRIWVMKEYNTNESWMKEFIIGAYTTTTNSGIQHLQPLIKVLCLSKNGELLMDYRWGNLVSYDPQNGVFRLLKFQGISNLFQGVPNLFQTIVHVGGLN